MNFDIGYLLFCFIDFYHNTKGKALVAIQGLLNKYEMNSLFLGH